MDLGSVKKFSSKRHLLLQEHGPEGSRQYQEADFNSFLISG
jgi:hypothetical protein